MQTTQREMLYSLLFKLKVIMLDKQKYEQALSDSGLKICFANLPGNEDVIKIISYVIVGLMDLTMEDVVDFLHNHDDEKQIEKLLDKWEGK